MCNFRLQKKGSKSNHKGYKGKKSVARREQRERRLQGGVSPGVLAVERKQ